MCCLKDLMRNISSINHHTSTLQTGGKTELKINCIWRERESEREERNSGEKENEVEDRGRVCGEGGREFF